MVSVIIGIGAGALVLMLCALLRWMPSGTVGKVLVAVWLVASGAWVGVRWNQLAMHASDTLSAVQQEKVAAVAERIWKGEGSTAAKVAQPESEKIVVQVTDAASRSFASRWEMSALRDAALQEAFTRRLSGKDGYVPAKRLRTYLENELPDILEIRMEAIIANQRTRLFGTACLLMLAGVFIAAVSRGFGRRVPREVPEE
jgi:hypothetical protein